MTRAILQELILQIWEELKLTVLFVTHDVEEAIFLSSNVISLGRAPSGIHDQRVVGLPYPRDQIRTREEPEFVNLRHRLLSTILAEEKSVTAPADAAGLR
jgi:NitT/TauT family transport system ATP-binding protein